MDSEDEAPEENYVREDEATEDNEGEVRRDLHIVSFDVNGDEIIEDSDAFGENAETTGSEGSVNEGEDQLSPLEAEIPTPRGPPCAAEAMEEFKSPSKRRFSSCVDIETGKDGGARTHKVLVSV
jgi:hypothetical protein